MDYINSIYKQIHAHDYNLIIITGPTSIGKSSIVMQLAQKYDNNCVLINGDSLQLYKALPVLCACPSPEELAMIDHRLYQQFNYDQQCNVQMWHNLARTEIDQAMKVQKIPIVVGGTGMYLNSLINPISHMPDIPNHVTQRGRAVLQEIGNQQFYEMIVSADNRVKDKINYNDVQRMLRFWSILDHTGKSLYDWQAIVPTECNHLNVLLLCLLPDNREKLYIKAQDKFNQMLNQGAIEEVKALMPCWDNVAMTLQKAIGALHIRSYLLNEIDYNTMVMKSHTDTRHYIKRQLTWWNSQGGKFNTANSTIKLHVLEQ